MHQIYGMDEAELKQGGSSLRKASILAGRLRCGFKRTQNEACFVAVQLSQTLKYHVQEIGYRFYLIIWGLVHMSSSCCIGVDLWFTWKASNSDIAFIDKYTRFVKTLNKASVLVIPSGFLWSLLRNIVEWITNHWNATWFEFVGHFPIHWWFIVELDHHHSKDGGTMAMQCKINRWSNSIGFTRKLHSVSSSCITLFFSTKHEMIFSRITHHANIYMA